MVSKCLPANKKSCESSAPPAPVVGGVAIIYFINICIYLYIFMSNGVGLDEC